MENKTNEKILNFCCPNCNCRKSVKYIKGLIVDTSCPDCNVQMRQEEEFKNSSILDEASKIINGDRQDSYGKPEDSFQIIASFWTTYLGHKDTITEGSLGLSAIDVAHMMTLFKIARMLGQKPKRDNYIDAAGYLAIAAERLISWPEPFDPEGF